MSQGFIYVLTNETMPGIVKIGKTKRMPSDRSAELYTTGVAMPFRLVFAILVDDVDTFERDIHEELEGRRVNPSREFFRTEGGEAILAILRLYACDFDHAVEPCDFVIDPGDYSRYVSICGVDPPDIVRVIDNISIPAWKAAAASLQEKRERRQRARASD